MLLENNGTRLHIVDIRPMEFLPQFTKNIYKYSRSRTDDVDLSVRTRRAYPTHRYAIFLSIATTDDGTWNCCAGLGQCWRRSVYNQSPRACLSTVTSPRSVPPEDSVSGAGEQMKLEFHFVASPEKFEALAYIE